jgi:hypothetical protein
VGNEQINASKELPNLAPLTPYFGSAKIAL